MRKIITFLAATGLAMTVTGATSAQTFINGTYDGDDDGPYGCSGQSCNPGCVLQQCDRTYSMYLGQNIYNSLTPGGGILIGNQCYKNVTCALGTLKYSGNYIFCSQGLKRQRHRSYAK